MRQSFVAGLIVFTFLLTGCQPNPDEGVKQVESVSHFFETTPTSSVDKAKEEEALAKAVITATKHASYPTPLATYLVPSNLTTYVDPALPTSTPTPLPATATPTATATLTGATATAVTPSTTFTVTPVTMTATAATATRTPTTPALTATRTATPAAATATATAAVYSFAIQSGTPVQIQNFANSSGCSWQGIAGQVFDMNGVPMKNLVVQAGGKWNGSTISVLGMTGLATGYGEGGYELVLGGSAVDTSGTVWVQLFDLSGNAISDKVVISTSSDCTKNLVLLNFKQIDSSYSTYLPLVSGTLAP